MPATLVRSYSTSGMVDVRLDDGRFLTLEAPRGRFAGLAGLHGTALIASAGHRLDHLMELIAFYPDDEDALPSPSSDHFPSVEG